VSEGESPPVGRSVGRLASQPAGPSIRLSVSSVKSVNQSVSI